MAAFAYKAVDAKGQKLSGTIQAESAAEAERRLVQQDAVILSLVPATGASKAASVSARPSGRVGKKVGAADASEVLRSLSVMAETGVPFVEALDAVIASAKTKTIEAGLVRVRDAVVGGVSLSGALKSAPEMFPAVVTDMVKIAESGGKLDAALGSGASYLERAADMKKKVANAMMYPCVMLGVCVLTLVIMVVVVMPKFAGVFSSMKAELPWLTKTMIGAGDAAKKNPLATLAVLAGSLFGGVLVFRLPTTRAIVNALALRTPLLGELIRRLALARALQSISTLSASGVPLLHAIEHGARVAAGTEIGAAFLSAREAIERGSSMSEAMAATGAFPRSTIQMVAVGERTGRLPELLKRLADGMETDVDARLKALVAVVEPLMIVIMGAVVGGITVSIIGPIYSVVENVK